MDHDKVTITKKDITGKDTVPGALIEVRDHTDAVVYKDVTAEDGSIKGMELKPGKYTFKEVLAPKGYAIKTSSLQFSVAADGVINTQEQEIRDELATYGLRKVDQQGKALQGAEFGLYCGEKLVDKAVSDEHGIVVFTQMDYGKYVIRELTAPRGYRLSKEVISFTIDGKWENQKEGDYKKFKNVKEKEPKKPMVKTKEKNAGDSMKGGRIAKTGDSRHMWIWIAMLIAAVAIGTTASASSLRKKNQNGKK